MKWSFVILIVFACVDLPCAFGAVLGIDLGGEFVKASVAAPGKAFNILLDESSKRKSPQLVVFDESQRLFGNGGTALSQRKPHLAYSYMKLLLGEALENPLAQSFTGRSFAHELVADGDRGTVRMIHSEAKTDAADADGDDVEKTVDDITSFLPEEILAMTLQYIRKLASNEVGSDVVDAVITVPSYYTQKQRMAALDAASIAGLNVLSLINENSAAALQYGVDKDYDPEVEELVLFYNIGSTRTEVSLVRYSAYKSKARCRPNGICGQFAVLASATDLGLSGQAFDLLLVEKFADEFNVQLKKSGEVGADFDVRNVPRTMAKLRKHSQKAKEVLSANKDKMVIIESLYKDIDFRSKVTRDELYELSDHLFERTLKPIKEVIKKAKVKRTDILECVLVGGGTRVKKIKDEIEAYIGSLSHKLNSDEAPALGAAFRAANISTSFRVRHIGMVDTFSYPIGVRIQDIPDGTETLSNFLGDSKPFSKRAALFKENNRLEKRKSVAFTHGKNVFITMHYDKGQLLPEGTSTDLGSYTVTGLEEFAEKHEDKGTPKLSLSFELNSNGVVELVRATASYTEEVEVKVPIKKAKVKKDRKKKDKDENDTSTTAEDGDKTEETSSDDGEKETDKRDADSEADKTEENADGDAEKPEEEEEDEEPKFEIKIEERETKETLKIERKYPSDFRPLNEEELEASRNVLQIFDTRDRATHETAEELNQLESYIYKARDHLDTDGIDAVASEDQLDSFRGALMDSEDWIYEDGERTAATYKDKLADLQSEGSKIFLRLHEASAYPAAVEQAQLFPTKVADLIDELRDKKKWLKETDFETLANRTADFTEWLEEQIELQAATSPFEPPKVTSDAIMKKLKKIDDYATSLKRRPKPADWGKDKTDDKKNGKSKKPADATTDPEAALKDLMDKMKPGEDGKLTPEQEEIIKRFTERKETPEFKKEQDDLIKNLREQLAREQEEERAKKAAEEEELDRATRAAFGEDELDADEDDDEHDEL